MTAFVLMQVQAAFLKMVKVDPIIFNHQMFFEKFDRIMAGVPEDARKHIWVYVRMLMITPVENKGKTNFRDWIKTNNLDDVFFVHEETQQQRYASITKRLQETERSGHGAEIRYMKMATQCQERAKDIRNDPFFREHRTDMERIFAAKEKIQAEWNKRRVTERSKRAQELSGKGNPKDQPFLAPSVRNINISADVNHPVHMTVYDGLPNLPYYCGYAGGTYIFQFKDPLRQDFANWYNGNSINGLFWSGDYRPSPCNPDSDPSNFTYRGCVPRSKKEHLSRLKVILGRVVHIVAATVSFYNWRCLKNGEGPDLLPPLKERAARGDTAGLNNLFRYWRFWFRNEYDISEEVRAVFRQSPVIAEFVSLAKMDFGMGAKSTQFLSTMTHLLTEATHWDIETLLSAEEERQMNIAFRCLRGALNEGGTCCLYYSEDRFPVSTVQPTGRWAAVFFSAPSP